MTSGSKIGYNNSIGGTTFVLLSNYNVATPGGEQGRVVSTSANDSSTGTGIQKVIITYFDTSWIQNTEVVTLNGTTPVNTVATNILRIESFEAFQVGTGLFAAGTITLTNLTGSSIFAQIDATYNRFNRALHFVTPGNVASITDITANCPTTGGVIFSIFTTKDYTTSGGGLVYSADTAFILANSTIHIPLIAEATLNYPILCDATNSTVGLPIGVVVKAIGSGQIGIATIHYIES